MEVCDRRNMLIKLIHVAKSKARTCNCGRLSFSDTCPACGKKTQRMPEFWYRSILEAMGGADTCGLIEVDGLQKVMDVFDEAGFKTLKPNKTRKQASCQRRYIVEREAAKLLGDKWKERLNGYAWRKYGREELTECTYEELGDLLGFVHRTAKYESRKKAKENKNGKTES